jgi:riboflavin biosynthesis pyrimidine reductase
MIERIFPPDGLSGAALDAELLAESDKQPAGIARVSFNFVSSIDGAATVDGRSGALGNADDQHLFQLLRRTADVIVVGAQTVRAEGYGGDLLSDAARQWRLEHGHSAHPPLAIVSGTLNLDPSLEVFSQAPVRPLVLTLESAHPDLREALSQVADVVLVGSDTLDVDRAIAELAARGLHRIHSEGGPTLLGTFQAAGRVDELSLTVSPLLAGGTAKRISDVLPGTVRSQSGATPQAMVLTQILKADSMLFLRYVKDPAQEV